MKNWFFADQPRRQGRPLDPADGTSSRRRAVYRRGDELVELPVVGWKEVRDERGAPRILALVADEAGGPPFWILEGNSE